MKKVTLLLAGIAACLLSAPTMQAQQRHIKVYSSGEEVYSVSTSGSNNLSFSGTNAVFSHNGSTWSTAIAHIDSLVFTREGGSSDDEGGSGTVDVDDGTALTITWNGSSVSIDNPFTALGVTAVADGADVTVTSTTDSSYLPYILTGSSSAGSITINTQSKLFLQLDNLSLTSASGPAILVASDKKAVFNLLGTSTLADNASSTGKGALQSAGKIAFQGDGTLNVSGLAKHGIQSSGSCTVNGGTLHVLTAVKDGMNVDNFIMNGGSVSVVNPNGDGIDGDQGYVAIYGGSVSISCSAADAKGLCCDSTLTIAGGEVEVAVSGAQSKGLKTKGQLVVSGGSLTVNATGTLYLEPSGSGYDPSYCTGIKVGTHALFMGGEVTVVCPTANAGGKAISADGNITVADGSLNLTATGSCAKYTDTTGAYNSYSSTCLKANGCVTVSGGTVVATAGGRAIACDGDYLQSGGSVTASTSAAGFTTIGSGTSCTDGFASACLKSDGNVSILAGSFSGTSTGKGGRGIKADGTMTIGTLGADDSDLSLSITTSGATVNSTSSSYAWKGIAKGLKIAGTIRINSGYVKSYCSQTSGDPTGEAIESKDSIFINGGVVETNAYDDAINAEVYIEFNGGQVWAYSRHNDAIDCNGTVMRLNGGTVIAIGSECAIDNNREANGKLYINGGTMVAIGGQMGAIESSPTSTGTQKGLTWGSSGGGGWGGGGGSSSTTLATNGFCVKTSGGEEVLTFKMSAVSGSGFLTLGGGADSPVTEGPGGGGPGGSGTSAIYVTSPSIQSGSYKYFSSPTVSGGTQWHGLYSGASVTTSGSGSSVTAQ